MRLSTASDLAQNSCMTPRVEEAHGKPPPASPGQRTEGRARDSMARVSWRGGLRSGLLSRWVRSSSRSLKQDLRLYIPPKFLQCWAETCACRKRSLSRQSVFGEPSAASRQPNPLAAPPPAAARDKRDLRSVVPALISQPLKLS